MRLTDEQISVLLRPINPKRIGKTPQGYSHVEAWDIRVWLIRIFGFCGWSLIETSPPACIFERERTIGDPPKPGISVAYRAHLAIVIHLPDGDVTYAGSAIAEAVNRIANIGDAHDQALKSAESGALKRAATNLGDQFGLSLYDDGSTKAVVQKVVGYHTVPTPAAETDKNESAPPVQPDSPPAPTQGPPASAGGDPLPSAEAPTSTVPNPAVVAANDALKAPQRVKLARWAKDNGIKNLFDPHLPDDKVQSILAHCELMQQGMA